MTQPNAPTPNFRIEETDGGGYRVEVYYDRDIHILEFIFDSSGRLIASGESRVIDAHALDYLLPVYPTIKEVPHGLLLTYSYSGLLFTARGRIGDKEVHYHHCPNCNGFVPGHTEKIESERAGLRCYAFYCRRCGAELTCNSAVLLKRDT